MSKAPKPPEETSPPAAATLDAAGDIVSLRMFRLVVELLSFSAAARRLGVQPGTVSKHITALEQRLGARLIQRTTRQLQITEAGDMLYGPCVKILDEIEQVGEDFSQLHGQPAGMLRV
ncbi:MAG: LysR family transcriptional regulator, partial [Haliea sp.]